MIDHILLTLAGPDKPGLVRTVADRVSELGGSWHRSRLSHLGGCFAGVVEVQLPAERRDALATALDALRQSGLSISLHAAEATTTDGTDTATVRAHIAVVANDRPGIIAAISQALALHGVNVEELQSDVDDAPMASGPLFRAEIDVSCDHRSQLEQARAEIESLAYDLMIDLSEA
ncbi:MAG: ACT domain-containing protein [Pseudomonadota bacterium]